jgi:hypothetical protein
MVEVLPSRIPVSLWLLCGLIPPLIRRITEALDNYTAQAFGCVLNHRTRFSKQCKSIIIVHPNARIKKQRLPQ